MILVMMASTKCSAFSAAIAFSLGKLGLSYISLKKEQRSAILAEYQGWDVSPNRVPWKEYGKSMFTRIVFLMDYKH